MTTYKDGELTGSFLLAPLEMKPQDGLVHDRGDAHICHFPPLSCSI